MSRFVYAIATMDTKAEEIGYVATCLRDAGVSVKVVDVGTRDEPGAPPDVSRQEVLGESALSGSSDRGEAVTAMGDALRRYLVDKASQDRVAGVIGIGGSGGTAIATTAMRDLPIGLPKLMVSTMASGNVAPYVDCSDITMMYSVVDVAGLNVVSQKVLANAAHAMAGMVSRQVQEATSKPCLGMTMFGVTTPCVTSVRQQLEDHDYDCLVFHATGTGGRAMEALVRSGLIRGVLDITTTEVADEVVGGILSAGPDRLDAIVTAAIPLVLSVGAVDMVNFGARETVPERFQDRNLHVHNEHVTLMRTTLAENVRIAEFIASKLNRAQAPFTILLPSGGVSMLDAPGQPFHDPAADEALFSTLETQIEPRDDRRVLRLPHNINDDAFAAALVAEFERLASMA